MNRRYFGLFILWLLTSAGFSQNNIIDEVAWIVGDEAILKSDVEDYRQKLRYEGTVLEGDPYCVIPEQIAFGSSKNR